jgi:katanin p80 WD40 repeat-containing subunit B1
VVNCVRIGRKSGQIIATGGDDKMVNIWNIANPDVILVIIFI